MPEPTGVETKEPVETEEIPKSELQTLRTKAKEHDRYGGERRTLEKEQQAVKKREEALVQAQKDSDAGELAKADGDDEINTIKSRQTARTLRAENEELKRTQERLEGELVESRSGTAKSEQERTARELAGRLNVNPETLVKFAPNFKSAEELEEFALTQPKLTGEKTLTVDSGRGVGSAGQSLEALMGKDIKTMTQFELREHRQALMKTEKGSLLKRR